MHTGSLCTLLGHVTSAGCFTQKIRINTFYVAQRTPALEYFWSQLAAVLSVYAYYTSTHIKGICSLVCLKKIFLLYVYFAFHHLILCICRYFYMFTICSAIILFIAICILVPIAVFYNNDCWFERKTLNRWYNIDTTAKQVAMVWACAATRRHWLGEEVYGIWGGGLQTKR